MVKFGSKVKYIIGISKNLSTFILKLEMPVANWLNWQDTGPLRTRLCYRPAPDESSAGAQAGFEMERHRLRGGESALT